MSAAVAVRRALAIAVAVLVCGLPARAETLPPVVRDSIGSDWVVSGRGEARWLGFSLYRASLWTAPGGYREAAPFALALRYTRGFERSALVSSSLAEMSRLGGDGSRVEGWRGLLERAFRDVKPGEVIVGVRLPGEGAMFYHQGRETARLVDEDFAKLFFAIWLDERTRVPDLRARLLGQGSAG